MSDKKIKFKDRQTVYATALAAPHYREGAEICVHPEQAKALLASGKATAEAPGTESSPTSSKGKGKGQKPE